jgi:hypothetical protein
MSIASKLSNSTYLKDLSTITGNDLVGSNANASSLGLASSYTVALLSYCLETDSSTTCSSPKFGFYFDPRSDLKLDDTGLQGSFSSSFIHTISSYGSTSGFLGVAYVLAFILTFITPAFSILAWCAPRAVIGGAITSVLSTIFLFAASVISIAIFSNVTGSFNSNLTAAGIKTALGSKLFILSWIATVLSLISSTLLCISSRRAAENRRGVGRGIIQHGDQDKDGAQVNISTSGPRKLTLLQRSLTWNRHKYSQIERQPAVRIVGQNDDEDVLLSRGFGGGEDEYGHGEEEELVRGSTRGIALTGLGGKKAKIDVETAYEPYRQSSLE